MTASKLSAATITLTFALIAVVAGWQLGAGITAQRVLFAVVLTTPLWAPLRGFLRRNRRTYAWATLCVIPYFILGVTEAIANPQRRIGAALCLALALTLFVTLILYLRASAPSEQPS